MKTPLTDLKTRDYKSLLKQNIVVIIFLTLTVLGAIIADQPLFFMLSELVSRMTRNSFLVLSLIIPIIAGIGLNFGIVVGAMAGQMGLIIITYYGVTGPVGIIVAALIATPLAVLFGFLTGTLYNKTKGQEMITGLIVSFFAAGIYQFIFLYLIGGVFPINPDTPMLKPDGTGLRNTISLGSKHGEGIKYGLDYIFRMNIWVLLIILCAAAVAFFLYQTIRNKKPLPVIRLSLCGIITVLALLILLIPGTGFMAQIKAPVVTWLLIVGLSGVMVFLMKTKLGQDFRSIGQSMHISKVSGINVNKTRTIAVILSTLFAAWGQIIFLQNIGTMNTYGSHMQVGLFASAAILIGGATVAKATIGQAILGTVLFHGLFIVSTPAGKAIFGADAQISEFFRAFVVYGVIGVSLGLHAWKSAKKRLKSQKAAV